MSILIHSVKNWTFLVYPNLAPKNWREIIASWNVAGCISPLHGDDLGSDGFAKRPHWHVLLRFDSPKSISQVEKLIAELHPSHPCAVESVRGVVRYFIHLDNPGAHQYNKEDIVCLSGFHAASLLA